MAVTEYTWNPLTDSVIEETDGAGNVLVEYTNEPAPYGPLISEHRGSESRQYHFDALGSTRAFTDNAETVTDTMAYDAWGVQIGNLLPAAAPYKWCGRFGYYAGHVELASKYLVRQRPISPHHGSWISTDRVLNPRDWQYGYVFNNPISRVDASGLCHICGWAIYKSGFTYQDLDAWVVGEPHKAGAQFWQLSMNKDLAPWHIAFSGLTSAGTFTVSNDDPFNLKVDDIDIAFKPHTATVIGHLFWVDFFVCETKDDPCMLKVVETGQGWRWHIGLEPPKWVKEGNGIVNKVVFDVRPDEVPPNKITHTGISDLRAPFMSCNRVIVSTDVPSVIVNSAGDKFPSYLPRLDYVTQAVTVYGKNESRTITHSWVIGGVMKPGEAPVSIWESPSPAQPPSPIR